MKKTDDHLAWKTVGRKRLNDFRIFTMYQVQRETAGGLTGTFYEVDAPDWVTIIPHIMDDKLGSCFLMVRQYRHGSDEITLELERAFRQETVDHPFPTHYRASIQTPT